MVWMGTNQGSRKPRLNLCLFDAVANYNRSTLDESTVSGQISASFVTPSLSSSSWLFAHPDRSTTKPNCVLGHKSFSLITKSLSSSLPSINGQPIPRVPLTTFPVHWGKHLLTLPLEITKSVSISISPLIGVVWKSITSLILSETG